jgi:hypothetical protein
MIKFRRPNFFLNSFSSVDVDEITNFVTLTEKVDCMEEPSIKEILIATGIQCFINMAME